MKSATFARLAVAGVLSVFIAPAFAEQPRGINVTAGDYLDIHKPFVGVGYSMPVAPRWTLEPNADYIFVNDGSKYSFNVDGRYRLNPSQANAMYVGAGLGVVQRNRAFGNYTDSAVNLVWSVDFNGYSGPVTPFINTRAVLSNHSDFGVSFGVRFGAPGHS